MTDEAMHLRADGTFSTVRPAAGNKFTLAELQGYVGGYIERAYSRTGAPMWVNEDGMRLALPVNLAATAAIRPDYLAPGGVLGDVLLVLTEAPDEDDEDEGGQ